LKVGSGPGVIVPGFKCRSLIIINNFIASDPVSIYERYDSSMTLRIPLDCCVVIIDIVNGEVDTFSVQYAAV
jgi:hypothetical protein